MFVVFQIFDFNLSDDDMNEIATKCDCNFRVLPTREYVTAQCMCMCVCVCGWGRVLNCVILTLQQLTNIRISR